MFVSFYFPFSIPHSAWLSFVTLLFNFNLSFLLSRFSLSLPPESYFLPPRRRPLCYLPVCVDTLLQIAKFDLKTVFNVQLSVKLYFRFFLLFRRIKDSHKRRIELVGIHFEHIRNVYYEKKKQKTW